MQYSELHIMSIKWWTDIHCVSEYLKAPLQDSNEGFVVRYDNNWLFYDEYIELRI